MPEDIAKEPTPDPVRKLWDKIKVDNPLHESRGEEIIHKISVISSNIFLWGKKDNVSEDEIQQRVKNLFGIVSQENPQLHQEMVDKIREMEKLDRKYLSFLDEPKA